MIYLDNYPYLATLLQKLDEEGRSGRNRIRVVLWNKDGAFPDATLVESMDASEFEDELLAILQDSAKLRALIDLIREVREPS